MIQTIFDCPNRECVYDFFFSTHDRTMETLIVGTITLCALVALASICQCYGNFLDRRVNNYERNMQCAGGTFKANGVVHFGENFFHKGDESIMYDLNLKERK